MKRTDAQPTEPLAIDGGVPVRSEPMPGWPVMPSEAVDAVAEVLSSGRINYWTGSQCRLFETEFAQYVGRRFGLAVANGTVALELALRGLGIGPGDEVVVPSRTFVATAGAVVAVGAKPVIADIDPSTNCMTGEMLAEVVSERTRAVIPVHLGGYPADLDGLLAVASPRGIAVVEDCAQAHGGRYKGGAIGSFGEASCFSFCQDKILPLGEGGMICFDDEVAYHRAWAYRDHGRSYAKTHDVTVGEASSCFRWLTDSFGTNARLGEMEGAIGRVMLRRLDEYHRRRTDIGTRLAAALRAIDGIAPLLPAEEGSEHAFYRLYAMIDPLKLAEGWTRDRVIAAVIAEGAPVQYGSCALIGHEAAFGGSAEASRSVLAGAREAHDRSIAFFVHPTLSDEDVDDISAAVSKVMAVATCA